MAAEGKTGREAVRLEMTKVSCSETVAVPTALDVLLVAVEATEVKERRETRKRCLETECAPRKRLKAEVPSISVSSIGHDAQTAHECVEEDIKARTKRKTSYATPSSRRRCSVPGCARRAQVNWVCAAHGGRFICREEGCDRVVFRKGKCSRHGPRCSTKGCTNGARPSGKCAKHGPTCKVRYCRNKAISGTKCGKHSG